MIGVITVITSILNSVFWHLLAAGFICCRCSILICHGWPGDSNGQWTHWFFMAMLSKSVKHPSEIAPYGCQSWSKHQDTSWKATWPPQMPQKNVVFFWETTINKDDIESPIEYDLGSLVSDVQGRPWWAYRSERRGRAHCDVARHKISTKD